jgi:hypothetical protein
VVENEPREVNLDYLYIRIVPARDCTSPPLEFAVCPLGTVDLKSVRVFFGEERKMCKDALNRGPKWPNKGLFVLERRECTKSLGNFETHMEYTGAIPFSAFVTAFSVLLGVNPGTANFLPRSVRIELDKSLKNACQKLHYDASPFKLGFARVTSFIEHDMALGALTFTVKSCCAPLSNL